MFYTEVFDVCDYPGVIDAIIEHTCKCILRVFDVIIIQVRICKGIIIITEESIRKHEQGSR